MHVDVRAYNDIWKKQFSGIPSRGLKRENKTYKLKKSILEPQDANDHTEEMKCSFNRFEPIILKVVTWPSLSLERSGVR